MMGSRTGERVKSAIKDVGNASAIHGTAKKHPAVTAAATATANPFKNLSFCNNLISHIPFFSFVSFYAAAEPFIPPVFTKEIGKHCIFCTKIKNILHPY